MTFLESVGRRSESELYLRLFRELPKESFAIIAVESAVVRYAAGSLVEQLRFLRELGLSIEPKLEWLISATFGWMPNRRRR